jgi:hypothetical protein
MKRRVTIAKAEGDERLGVESGERSEAWLTGAQKFVGAEEIGEEFDWEAISVDRARDG